MAHTFENLSFEEAKAGSLKTLDGNEIEPASWTVVEWTTAQETIDFPNPEYLLALESFEIGWGNDDFLFAFVGVAFDLEAAIFDAGPSPQVVETFEQFWSSNEDFLFVLGRTEAASFGASLELFDGFENGWGNDAFVFVFDDSVEPGTLLEAATSNPEDFESGWSNDSYLTEFDSPGTQLDAAEFASSDPFESFDDVTPDYVWAIRVDVPTTSTATYRVTINGEVVEYVGQSEDDEAIRDELKSRIDNLSLPLQTQAIATNPPALYIGSTVLPPNLLLRLDLNGATAGEEFTKEAVRDFNLGWDQSGVMATL